MKSIIAKSPKALSLLLCIALCLNMAAPAIATEDPGTEAGIVASGDCGDNLTWELDGDGTLTISGTGDMENFRSAGPWYDYRDGISGVIIENGVTSIGSSAFSECFDLTFIDIPSSVTSIGSCAFLGCPYLSEIYIKEGVTNIGGWAFYCCSSLGYLSLPKSITSIGDSAFYGCSNLNTVNYGGTEAEWNEIQIGEDNKYLLNSNIVCVQVKVVASGYCGENSTWELNSEGVLTISGTGNMNSYSPILGPKSPWYDYRQSIKDVIISSGVTSVGEGSFYNCNSLTNITIPETVTGIGYYAFYNCSSLTSVTIPEGVTSIGDHAFYGCSSLTSITIPEGVTSIGEWAFYGCDSLTSVTIPEGVTSIGDYAFYTCSSLTSVTIPEGVTSIGDKAFYDCARLECVTLPISLTSIGDEPIGFYNVDQYGVLKLYYPGTLEEFAKISFEYEYQPWLACLCILDKDANGNDIWVRSSFAGENFIWRLDADGLLTISGSGEMTYSCWSWYRNEIKKVVFNGSVSNIADYAFSGCAFTSISIPEGVTSIGDYAFKNCSALTSITIPQSVTSIGEDAFYYCYSLKETYYSGTLEDFSKIELDTGNDQLLSSLHISAKDNEDNNIWLRSGFLGENLVWTLDAAGKLTISGSGDMTKYDIPWQNFSEKVKTVVIEPGVTSISQGAFVDCSTLTSVTIPSSVTGIGKIAFYNCSSLTYIIIPEGVTSIGELAFYNCSALTSITIPQSVTSIGEDAFRNCYALKDTYYSGTLEEFSKIELDTGNGQLLSSLHISAKDNEDNNIWLRAGVCGENLVWTLDAVGTLTISGSGDMTDYSERYDVPWYEYRGEITSVVIDSGVTSIGSFAFYQCHSLTSVTMSEELRSIGYQAFYAVYYLASITIPKSVVHIADSAFASCYNLRQTYYYGTVEEFNRISIGTNNGYFLSSIYYLAKDIAGNDTWAQGGPLGDSLFWTLDSEGTLTIYGNGDMPDAGAAAVPWSGLAVNDVVIKSGVTSIGPYVFYNTKNLVSITVPDSVTIIGNYAFYGCNSLANISIPNSVVYIGESAFFGCRALASVIIPEGVTNIEAQTFSNCSSLQNIIIPEGVTSIGQTAFSKCSSLMSITIPGSVTNIGKGAFRGTDCEITVGAENEYYHVDGNCLIETATNTLLLGGSKSVIPNYVTTIGYCAFYYCSALTGITIPEGVTSIGQLAFADCPALTNIILPEGVTSIEGTAFRRCTALESVTIPQSMTSIETYAFSGCDSLTDAYYIGSEAQWADISTGEYNDPLLNATIHYNYVAEEEIPEEPIGSIGSIDAVITAPEGGWKVGENTFKVEAEKACFVAVSYDGGNTFMRVPAIQDANGGYRFTAENMDASTVVSVGYVGDVDGDGIIRARDARLALQAASGMEELSGLGHLAADLDNDGIIRAREARLMLQAASDMHTLDW